MLFSILRGPKFFSSGAPFRLLPVATSSPGATILRPFGSGLHPRCVSATTTGRLPDTSPPCSSVGGQYGRSGGWGGELGQFRWLRFEHAGLSGASAEQNPGPNFPMCRRPDGWTRLESPCCPHLQEPSPSGIEETLASMVFHHPTPPDGGRAGHALRLIPSKAVGFSGDADRRWQWFDFRTGLYGVPAEAHRPTNWFGWQKKSRRGLHCSRTSGALRTPGEGSGRVAACAAIGTEESGTSTQVAELVL